MLTRQQELFVRYLAMGDSQRTAYRKAYPKSKAKDSSIDDQASKLLAKTEVKHRYEEVRSELIEQTKRSTIADATEILESLTRYIRADIYDLTEIYTDGEGKQRIRTTKKGGDIVNGLSLEHGNTNVKIPDRIQALKLLADLTNVKEKNMQADNIKQEITVSFGDGGDYFD